MTGRKPRKYPMRPIEQGAPIGKFWLVAAQLGSDPPRSLTLMLQSWGPFDVDALMRVMAGPVTVRVDRQPHMVKIERLA